MFKKYKAISSVIEAVQFTFFNKHYVYKHLVGHKVYDLQAGEPVLIIENIHREKIVINCSDWIIKDFHEGYYYTTIDRVFKQNYTEVKG